METQTAMHDAARSGPGIAQVLRLAWALPRRPGAAFDDLFDRYGDVVWVSLPPLMSRIPWLQPLLSDGSRVALLRDPALIKSLLAAPAEVASATEPRHNNLDTLWGDRSLFLLEGPPHRRLRKLMLPRLRGEALTQWRQLIVASVEREVHGWVDEPTVAVHPRMLDLSLELILKVALSVPDSAMPRWKPPWQDLLKIVPSAQMQIRLALRSVGAMRLWPRFQRDLHMCNRLVFDEIARRRRHPELQHNDLVDLLMRADGEPLPDRVSCRTAFRYVVCSSLPRASAVAAASACGVRTSRSIAQLANVAGGSCPAASGRSLRPPIRHRMAFKRPG